ncbi:ADP-ribosylglycohydrolase family protein [Tomitella fengzijianii]|uniref:ADP-ribosylglycohydrolase family protein n=1 Tax=Tomitella fengzijianii TaxID=2597660 RepID=UPI001E504E49|nr:ADP-ribosylglycohydrolase family protein [Tomitella fengzijianii]
MSGPAVGGGSADGPGENARAIADRARGALLGTAAGDALGAGYEFTHPGPDAPIVMKGGGPFGFEPGEWTDDTAMTAAIARAATVARLDTTAGLDAVAEQFLRWQESGPKDMGNQTRRVLSRRADSAAVMQIDAAATGPDNAGNGSLMRTAAVAVAFAADEAPADMLSAASRISLLTHTGVDTQLACQVWSLAIWSAIRTGSLPDLHGIVSAVVPADALDRWQRWVTAAETQQTPEFEHNNGWVVSALQTAWWGIHRTRPVNGDPEVHIRRGLAETVRAGHDTDTTAAIAGGLLGAVYGAAALPAEWTEMLHGWPGLNAAELAGLADEAVR